MATSRLRAVLYGAVTGTLLALMSMALFGGRFGLQSAVAIPVAEGSPIATTYFVASTGGLILLVIVIGVLAGLAIAGAAYAFARESDADAPMFPLRYLLPVAGVVSALFAYLGLWVGVLGWGDDTAGITTIPVLDLIVIAAVTGAVSGSITAAIVDRLARPVALGLGGVAWPTSPGALMGEAARAVGTPIIAVVVAGGFAILLAEVLLALEGTAAIVVFGLAGAFVLGGAALLAYRPWESRRTENAAS